MPTIEAFLGFALAAFIIIAIPGPSVLFVIGRSLTYGRRNGLLSVLGNCLGVVPVVVAVAFGLGAVVAESIVLFTIIKFLGAGYLIYLGIQGIRHRRQGLAIPGANDSANPAEATAESPAMADSTASDESPAAATPTVPAMTARRTLVQGMIVGISNPKNIVFFVAALPQFITPETGSAPLQMLVLGLTFQVIALVSDSIWALVAGTGRAWFAKSPRRLSRIRGAGGAMLVGLGGTLALARN